MERTKLDYIKKLYGKNFLGVDEVKEVFDYDYIVPELKYDINVLEKYKNTHILILGCELSIVDMRDMFGFNEEPRFYNQDWYLDEDFAKIKLKNEWYLLQKDLSIQSRGKFPNSQYNLPSAALTTYTFFVNYLNNNEILWENDYVWNSDRDSYDDQIYTGKYNSGGKIKNGFNIHRHLTIKNNYGSINLI